MQCEGGSPSTLSDSTPGFAHRRDLRWYLCRCPAHLPLALFAAAHSSCYPSFSSAARCSSPVGWCSPLQSGRWVVSAPPPIAGHPLRPAASTEPPCRSPAASTEPPPASHRIIRPPRSQRVLVTPPCDPGVVAETQHDTEHDAQHIAPHDAPHDARHIAMAAEALRRVLVGIEPSSYVANDAAALAQVSMEQLLLHEKGVVPCRRR